MSIKLSWTPKPTTENTRIYRGTSLDKLDLKAELSTRDPDGPLAPHVQADGSINIPSVRMVPSDWIDTDQLPLGDHFYAVVVGEKDVYSEPAVIKLTLSPAKPVPVTGLKIEVVPDVVPTAPELVVEPLPAEAPVLETEVQS